MMKRNLAKGWCSKRLRDKEIDERLRIQQERVPERDVGLGRLDVNRRWRGAVDKLSKKTDGHLFEPLVR
jgi:hypothetical protein